MRKSLLVQSALVAWLALGGSAAAQTHSEEIIVTAKQRAQSIQDVPLAITAVDAATIESAGIEDIRDLSTIAPGLSFHSNSGRKDLSALAIRGLAPNTVNVQLQGVSSFYDGIYTGGAINLIPMVAVDRVEVLKGPQSSTYGRATYSGAIDYITQTPQSDTVIGSARFEYSQNEGAVGDNMDITLSVAVPLIEGRAWLQAIHAHNVEGALYNAPTTGIPIGEEVTDSYGLIFYTEPTSNLSIKAFAFYDVADDGPAAIHMQHPQEWAAAGLTTGGSVSPGAVWLDDDVPAPLWGTTECVSTRDMFRASCGSYSERLFAGLVATYDLNGYEVSYRGGYYDEDSTSKYDTTSRGAAGGSDPFFGDSVTALLRKNTAGINQRSLLEGYSHQLRIVSPADNRLRWRAGVYYFYEESNGYSQTYLTVANPQGVSGGTESVEDIAAFGAIAYDFTDALGLELEGRVQEETVVLGACTFCAASIANPLEREASTTDWMPRVTLTWRPTEDFLFYGLYSYGAKSGRWNNASAVGFRFTEPEYLSNYELGAKTSWFDGALLLNGALFVQEVTDQQFTARDPVNTSITYSQNIGESDIWGFELDGRYRITDDLSLFGTLSYADHEYASFAVPSVAGAAVTELLNGETLQGKTSVNIPRWNASTSLVYNTEFGTFPFGLRADVIYRGESYADAANRATLAPVTRVNLAATLGIGLVDFRFFVRDLFDNDEAMGAASSPTSCVYGVGLPASFVGASSINTQRCLAVTVPRGREIGASFAIRF